MKKEGKKQYKGKRDIKGFSWILCAFEQEDFCKVNMNLCLVSCKQKEEVEESMEKKECPLAYLKLLKNDVVQVVCLLFGQREQWNTYHPGQRDNWGIWVCPKDSIVFVTQLTQVH